MSYEAAADRRKRDRKSTHKEKKRKKSRPSVDVVEGDREVIKLKVEHGLLQELQLTSISTFPKPLREYIDDRSKLLDEVFTVLSRDDIECMLPDILKGLKMKRIKELCGGQLAKLDDDTVVRVLSGQEENMPSATEQPLARHGTPVAPLGDSRISSVSINSSLQEVEFSDVSDQEQQPESSSSDLRLASAASSDRVGKGRERTAWPDARGEEGDGGESTKNKETAPQLMKEHPAPCGGFYDAKSDEDGLAIDITTAITDSIDMELAGEAPKNEPQKQSPPVSRTLQPAHKAHQHRRKKRKHESHTVTQSTSSSEQTDSSTLENKLRKTLLSRVQQQGACSVSDKVGKEAEALKTSMASTPPAASPVDSQRELELRIKEKALKSLLTKSLSKRVL